MRLLALLLLCAAPYATVCADAPVAIFAEPGFPYYIASSEVTPEFVRYCLKGVGIKGELINASQLGDPTAFNANRYKALAYVYGNTFPVAAIGNVRRFCAEGGCIAAFGGVPFCHPCVFEDGAWVDKIAEMGWELVSHQKMGTGLWAEANEVDAARHAPGDPLGIAWMPLPPRPHGIVQFPRLGMKPGDSKALGFEHHLGFPSEDIVTPVVSVLKDNAAVGHPVCIIKHHCSEFNGAVDIWAGTTLSSYFSMQQHEQLIVASCAYLLERAGVMTKGQRRNTLARVRSHFVAPLKASPPREGPFMLRANPPAKRLVVLDVMGLNPDERVLALTLQGIVNRKEPRVYLIGAFKDMKWLDVLRDEGCEHAECDSLDSLVAAFRDDLAGAIVYDQENPYTINVATMLAGVKNAVIATPELARHHRLKIVADLRGRFAGAMKAYEWALDTLWPQLDHRAIACMAPAWAAPRDYLVQFRIFTFWLNCRVSHPIPPEQVLFFERLLAKTPPHGQVYGWWQHGDDSGIGEGRGVTVSSRYGKITVCTVGAYNLSVHSGARTPKSFVQETIRYGSLDDKVYVAFIVSDGDNFGMNLYSVIARLWGQKMRGKVPIGWGICPTQVELTPAVVRYFYQTATPNDLFVAMDGLGYVYPDHYGSALGDPSACYEQFLRQTKPYMRQLDQHYLWFLGGTTRAEQMARVLSLDGVFGEYGVPAEQKQMLLGDTPAIWADVNPWEKPYDKVGVYIKRIRERTPAKRPAFIFVGANGFCIGPNEVARILRELGPDYVAVRPDELCYLYKKYRTSGIDPNPVPRPALDLSAPPPGPRTTQDGKLIVREDDNDPDVTGWHTDPKGTQWVRKRLTIPLTAAAEEGTVYVLARGEQGKRVIFMINGREHAATIESAAWGWVTLKIPSLELRNGENDIWYTGNPDGRLLVAGDASTDLDHSDYGGPKNWTSLSGELMCYIEVR